MLSCVPKKVPVKVICFWQLRIWVHSVMTSFHARLFFAPAANWFTNTVKLITF